MATNEANCATSTSISTPKGSVVYTDVKYELLDRQYVLEGRKQKLDEATANNKQ